MSDANLPWLEYRMIPIPDRGPAVLATLAIRPPAPNPIAIVLDLSDSCADLSRSIAFLRKALSPFPGTWPLWIYRLSSALPIGRDDLRLMDFVEAEDVLQELCHGTGVIAAAKEGGSFLRPVIESLNERIESSETEISPLAFVVTDGRFTDFGDVDPHARLNIAAITPSQSPRPLIPTYTTRDAGIDALLNQYRSPFFGAVTLQPIFRPDDSADSAHTIPDVTGREVINEENLYRVDEHGRLSPWSQNDGQLYNLSRKALPILIDGPLDSFQQMRWKVQSTATRATTTIQGGMESKQGNRTLEKSIVGQFARGDDTDENNLVFEADCGSPAWSGIVSMSDIAFERAADGQAWIDDDDQAVVMLEEPIANACLADGRFQCDAILMVRCINEATSQLARVLVFGLDRNRPAAFAVQETQAMGEMTANSMFQIHFDPKVYRWFATVKTNDPIELEYYGAEVLQPFLRQPGHQVDICFSGNLR